MSHPAWVCGLKHTIKQLRRQRKVTPCVGVWIETKGKEGKNNKGFVTPCVGVWIETRQVVKMMNDKLSHPAWVCGLKLDVNVNLVGCYRHTLRGCVD